MQTEVWIAIACAWASIWFAARTALSVLDYRSRMRYMRATLSSMKEFHEQAVSAMTPPKDPWQE